MKSIFYAFSLLLGLSSCKKDSEKASLPETTQENPVLKFRKNLYQNKTDSVFQKYDFNGSIAVYEDTVMLARKEAGFENFRDQTPISSRTVFAIGSVSKQFTAVMLLKLAEKGSLQLSDSVFHYLKDFSRKGFRNITVRQLMNHTSGISDSGDGLLAAPGKEFSYSNKGYFFLEQVIEKATGKSFDESATEFFREAGLQHTCTARNFTGENFGGAYTGTIRKPQPVAGMPQRLANHNISTAAGGILSTVDDLLLWNRKLYGGKIISKASLTEFLAPTTERGHPFFGTTGYGLGIMLNKNLPQCYFHSGYVKGSPSLNLYYPGTKTSVIILSNIADENLGKKAVFRPHLEMKSFADHIETAYRQSLTFNNN